MTNFFVLKFFEINEKVTTPSYFFGFFWRLLVLRLILMMMVENVPILLWVLICLEVVRRSILVASMLCWGSKIFIR